MYMYYLLGYRLLGSNDESIYNNNQSEVGRPRQSSSQQVHCTSMAHRSRIFRSMNYTQKAQVRLPAVR